MVTTTSRITRRYFYQSRNGEPPVYTVVEDYVYQCTGSACPEYIIVGDLIYDWPGGGEPRYRISGSEVVPAGDKKSRSKKAIFYIA